MLSFVFTALSLIRPLFGTEVPYFIEKLSEGREKNLVFSEPPVFQSLSGWPVPPHRHLEQAPQPL